MKRPDVGHWIMATIILILGLFLWLTPYQYKKMGPYIIVRIHRLTGEADRLLSNGWRPMGQKPQKAITFEDLGLEPPENWVKKEPKR